MQRKKENKARLEQPSISPVLFLPFELFVRQLQSATVQLQRIPAAASVLVQSAKRRRLCLKARKVRP